jgi:hypothetical protein
MRPDFRATWAPALIAALLVIGGTLLFLKMQTGETAGELSYTGDQFRMVMGSGNKTGKQLLIERYDQGVALASVSGLNLDPDVHHWLNVDIESDVNAYAPVFFWRQKGRPLEVSRMELPGPGAHVMDLAGENDWQGEIIEIGFLFEDPQGRTARLNGASLHSDSLSRSLKQVLDEWAQFEPWSQRSINILSGGPRDQVLPLPLFLLIWVLSSLLIYAVMNSRRNDGFFRFALVIFLMAWVILDVRWTRNQTMQSNETINSYVTNPQSQAATADGYLQAYISGLKQNILSDDPGKILLIADDSVAEFYLLKARYYLLPTRKLWITCFFSRRSSMSRRPATPALFHPTCGNRFRCPHRGGQISE